jgi:LAO/AO transport system kinase
VSSDARAHGEALLLRGQRGEIAAVSQLITALEANTEVGQAIRRKVHAAGGGAHVIGITGSPGSGKSTLVAALVQELRARDRRVGVVAVDPSSSLSGGAILGDRIRMQAHTLDRGAFVRSMSSRGWLGGVSRATVDAVGVLDATGWDVIIVETVGVGQADVEIVQIAHTTVVVSVPGLGDDIQAIKAGLLEVADLHVVNKADRPDANRTMAELLGMLTLAGPPAGDRWAIPVLATTGLSGEGVPELADVLDGHMAWLKQSGELEIRERAAVVARLRAIAKELLVERLHDPSHGEGFEAAVDDVVARRRDPHEAAALLIERLAVTHEVQLERTNP